MKYVQHVMCCCFHALSVFMSCHIFITCAVSTELEKQKQNAVPMFVLQ